MSPINAETTMLKLLEEADGPTLLTVTVMHGMCVCETQGNTTANDEMWKLLYIVWQFNSGRHRIKSFRSSPHHPLYFPFPHLALWGVNYANIVLVRRL